jgi:hypothetical protein
MDAALAGVLRPPATSAGAADRIVRGALRRLEHLERIEKEFVVDATERGIVAIRPGKHGVATGRAAGLHAEQAREELHEYLEARRVYFSVPVDLTALAPFQRSVLEQAARVLIAGFGDRPRRRVARRRHGTRAQPGAVHRAVPPRAAR